MRFVYTRHAEAVLAERKLAREWVERTVLAPDSLEPDPGQPGVFRAFRAVPERRGHVLRVVYVTEPDAFRILTAFLDRSRRR